MLIRPEKAEDYQQIYQLVKSAFDKAEHSDGKEQDLVEHLRQSQSFIPELALVAEINDEIVGYILFTQVRIGENIELALAPLAVLPTAQRLGVGKALIKRGHEIAKQLGYHYVIVLGNPHYYGKLGYQPARQFQMTAPFEIDDAFFMAVELNPPQNNVQGVVQYADEFGI
ncbi:GNAT family N-acetyltransferase [Rodentibacter trehalosifermentans]|uniref:GNAT family N-acetyltransferase n=1 Tax=Rodentibacter trehalosifermentans TaxID=1908263 RepID=A0A1V3J0R5_9PAST|nr:N-acetyltransferase [Rodentibacter trehalosifermentans]OOF46358.1 GNAT family N-acetyltransferase [Rodentibacter trehalosifermentans]OOF48492.1 GNAT family N-acetyltransferase [Rodentibacter trehalosifermentans]OOF53218.1 GNAT family N-acetyltransferase [Rodentibacter trehalosifermentans]